MLPNDHDLEKIQELDWIPSDIIEKVMAGGWFNAQKYRVLLNGSPISGKEKSIVGPHTVSVHKWKGVGGTIEWGKFQAKWNFWIPGTDAGGIEWTETGMVKGSDSGEEQQDAAGTPAGLDEPSSVINDPDCMNPPLSPEDPSIQKGNASPAVLAFQNWAVGKTNGKPNHSSVDVAIEMLDGKDDPHGAMKWKLGTLDMITSAELMFWQAENEQKIRAAAGHAGNSEEDKQWWEKEKATIGWATWKILQPVMGAKLAKCGETKEEEIPEPDADIKPVDSSAPKQKGKATHYVLPRFRTEDHPKGKYKTGDPRGQIVYKLNADGSRTSLGSIKNYTLIEVREIGLGNNHQNSLCRFVPLDEQGKPTSDIAKFFDLHGKYKDYKGDVYGEFYTKTRRLKPFSEDWEPLPRVDTSPAPGHPREIPYPADWTKLPGNIKNGYNCYLDVKSKTYRTKIRPMWWLKEDGEVDEERRPFKTADDWLKFGNKERALYVATTHFCRFYGKQITIEDKKKLSKSKAGPFLLEGTKGLHRDERPDSDVELLVCFPQQVFDAIPDEQFSEIELEEEFDSDRAIHFEFSNANDRIHHAAGIIEKHATFLESSFPKVSSDMKKAAKKIKSFYSNLREFLLLNGLTNSDLEKKESTIEIGFADSDSVLIKGSTFTKQKMLKELYGENAAETIYTTSALSDFWIEYVLHSYDDEQARPLMVGIDDFVDMVFDDDASGATALHYLFALDSLIKTSRDSKLPSTEFVKKFHFPFANLHPAKAGTKEEPKPPHTNASKPNAADPAKAEQEKAAKKHKAPPGQGKTKDQRRKEDAELANKERKLWIRRSREKSIDFTGANLVEDMVYLSKNVKTVDDVFIHFLNRTNLEQMAEIAVSALLCSMSNEDREKLMAARLIARASMECIEAIHHQLQVQYPETYEKVKKAILEKSKDSKAGGKKGAAQKKGAEAAPPTPNALKGKDGNKSDIKEAKASRELNETELSGKFESTELQEYKKWKAKPENSGASIVSDLPEATKKELTAAKGDPTPQPNPNAKKDDLTNEQKKDLIKELIYDQKEAYQIARPLLTAIIYSCIPDHEVQHVIESFLQKVDKVQDMLPSRPVKGPPTAPVPPDDKKTKDPVRGVDDAIAEAIRAALAGALMAAVILIVKSIKEAVDNSDCNTDYGAADGLIDDTAAQQGFAEAGIPPDLAPDFMACLTKKLTKQEMLDLLHGIIPDEVKAIIKICAAKCCPEHLSQLPEAFENMADKVDPDAFEDEDEPIASEVGGIKANPDGLLCSEDEESPLDIDELDIEAANRNRDLVEKIQDIMDDVSRLIPPLPPILSDCGEEGVIPRDPPAIDRMNDMVIGSIFVGPKMTFRDDSLGMKNAMVIKELRPAQKGDMDWVPDSGDNAGLDPSTGQRLAEAGDKETITRINQKNSKIRQSVGAKLREDLIYLGASDNEDVESRGIWINALDDAMVTNFGARVLPSIEQMVTEKFAEAQGLSDEIEELIEEIAKLNAQKSSLGGSYKSFHLQQKLIIKEKALKDKIELREKKAAEAAGIEKGDVSSNPLEIQRVTQENLMYTVPYVSDKSKIKDEFEIKFQRETTPPTNKLNGVLPSKSLTPANDLPNETSKYDIVEGEATPQAEVFANYITQRYLEAGHTLTVSPLQDWTEQKGYGALRLAHKNIFENLLRLSARQVSFSPVFDINYWENVSFSKQAVENEGPCAPGEGEPVDLLALAKIQQEVKDEYEKSCESVRPEGNETTALENAARMGVVKTFTRLYMVEMFMKASFVLSEFNVETSLRDNLVLEYILEKFKSSVMSYDTTLYQDMLIDARKIIDNKIKNLQSGQFEEDELENLFELNDMKVLLEEEGTEVEQQEAALKYLALEQFGDLAEKFELALGSRSPDVHKRFLNPPENAGTSTSDKESTSPGFPVMIPQDKSAGWIRMIDAPVAMVSSRGDNRFITNEPMLEVPPGLGEGSQTLALKFPDLAHGAGTFFLERYVRVEDKDISEIPDGPGWHTVIRERVGGPEGPAEADSESADFDHALLSATGLSQDKYLKNTEPHLSGVVNIHAWERYIKDLPLTLENILTVEHCLQPLRWGIRLVYVPPMQKNQHSLINASYKVTSNGPDLSSGGWVTKNKPVSWGTLFPAGGAAGYNNTMSAWNTLKDNAATGGGFESDGSSVIEEDIIEFFDSNVSKARKEKAFNLVEKIDMNLILNASDSIKDEDSNTEVEQTTTVNSYTQYKRPVVTIPLASYEEEIPIEHLGEFDPASYDSAAMREKLIATEQYQYLFNYVFPLPRMISLLTIYSANSIALSIPETETAFDKTKGALRNLYYSLSPDKEGGEWWDKPPSTRPSDHFEHDMNNINPKGANPDYAAMALRTVPILIRGMADYMDPHYKLVSRLVDYGILPTGKTWASVPIFWPVNWLGWGPPMTPLGMAAYSMPQLSGDKPGGAAQAPFGENEWKTDPDTIDCDD